MLVLHDYLPSQNGWKIRVVLGLLDIAYQTHNIALFEGNWPTEAFLVLNPTGAIPVLELEDGRAIAESAAILGYLAEGTPLFPSDRYDRAKIAQWLSFEQYYIEPFIGSLRFWTLTNRLERNQGMVEAKREGGARALAALDRSLRHEAFLAGAALSIADIAAYAYGHLAGDCGFDFSAYPAVGAWIGRVGAAIGPGYPVHPYSIDPNSGG